MFNSVIDGIYSASVDKYYDQDVVVNLLKRCQSIMLCTHSTNFGFANAHGVHGLMHRSLS